MLREFEEPANRSDEERLNWIATLVSMGKMEIKVAVASPNKSIGMYHEKNGLMYDSLGNTIAFTGSMNETINGFYNNYESIFVFSSLRAEDSERVKDIENDFNSLWSGNEENVNVFTFPEAVKEKILTYKKDSIDLELDKKEELKKKNLKTEGPLQITDFFPRIPNDIELRDYQIEAIDNWERQSFRGIFDMATGTGKTLTGLGAITRLYESNKRLAIVIVCPYQHLVEQWVEDIKRFNIDPIIGYSASRQTNWKKRLKDCVFDFKHRLLNTFCFVTTNATFLSDYVQQEMSKIGRDTLLLVDEAHNFGATTLRKTLNDSYEYRLALSATLDRHNDPEGTALLYSFFGGKCIEYDLERAIQEKKLTPYYYYPVVVYLTEKELEKYRDVSYKISKHCFYNDEDDLEINDAAKVLFIQRARVVAGAKNKIYKLRELIANYVTEDHILIYCGATKDMDIISDVSERDVEGERQIVSVSKMLGLDFGMKVTHFTSSESSIERELIKKQFADRDPYQALVAIKCLDEGVNIPSIKTAFILASSTNPKEYIQRRGRVLRLYKDKKYATIYDFVTLPKELEKVDFSSEEAHYDYSLITKEITRMKEFGRISLNPSDSDRLIKILEETYGLDRFDGKEFIYG